MLLASICVALAAAPVAVPGEGWSVTPPEGWTVDLAVDGTVSMVAPGGAGIVARLARGSTEQQLLGELSGGLPVGGTTLPPSGPAAAWSGGGTMAGFGGPGVEAQVLLLGGAPAGAGTVVVMAVTPRGTSVTAELEGVARSVRWTAAPVVGGGLSGAFCAYEGGASGSTSRRLAFQADGRVASRTTVTVSGSYGDGLGSQAGSFGGLSGGEDVPGTWRLDGDGLVIRQDAGGATSCTVAERAGGSVVALRCDGRLYTPKGCE